MFSINISLNTLRISARFDYVDSSKQKALLLEWRSISTPLLLILHFTLTLFQQDTRHGLFLSKHKFYV